ncbi:hypothetical protein [Streptomyces sp. NPDC056399]|uniref:hypothetical protein n=1 Tax=Streptomyces sp. NPDC056399 TaxID=3345807 RepID=UPI0035DB30F9
MLDPTDLTGCTDLTDLTDLMDLTDYTDLMDLRLDRAATGPRSRATGSPPTPPIRRLSHVIR